MWKSLFYSSFVCVVFSVGPSFSEGGAPQPRLTEKDPSTETRINSKRMTVRNREQEAVFEENVVLFKGSLGLTVLSDRMVVFFDQKKSPENGTPPHPQLTSPASTPNHSIQRIEASGNVRIKKDKGKATCQKAVYFEREQKVVLTGNPVAWQDGNRITGTRIILYLKEDRTVVDGGAQVILTESQEGGP